MVLELPATTFESACFPERTTKTVDDNNAFHVLDVRIDPPADGIALVKQWDDKLDVLCIQGLNMSEFDLRYCLHAGARSTSQLDDGQFLYPWLRMTLGESFPISP
jgi:hypothetical protein